MASCAREPCAHGTANVNTVHQTLFNHITTIVLTVLCLTHLFVPSIGLYALIRTHPGSDMVVKVDTGNILWFFIIMASYVI